MSTKNYIWFNGDIINGDNPILTVKNRAFHYGDGVFETIHAYGTQGRNLNLHVARLKRNLELLKINIPTYLDERMVSQEISRLLNKNRQFSSVRVRMTVYRDSEGYYIPENNRSGIIMETSPLDINMYQLNPKGYLVDIFGDIKKPLNLLSSVKSCNSLIYIMAGIYKLENRLSDCILVNDQGRIAEAISSNIFLIKDDSLFTPAISEGCIPGVMREVVIKVAPEVGLKVNNNVAIPIQKLLECDEVLLTNTITGIRWVVAFRNQRYFSKYSRLLTDAVNRYTFPDQFKDGFSG